MLKHAYMRKHDNFDWLGIINICFALTNVSFSSKFRNIIIFHFSLPPPSFFFSPYAHGVMYFCLLLLLLCDASWGEPAYTRTVLQEEPFAFSKMVDGHDDFHFKVISNQLSPNRDREHLMNRIKSVKYCMYPYIFPICNAAEMLRTQVTHVGLAVVTQWDRSSPGGRGRRSRTSREPAFRVICTLVQS